MEALVRRTSRSVTDLIDPLRLGVATSEIQIPPLGNQKGHDVMQNLSYAEGHATCTIVLCHIGDGSAT